MVSLDLSGFGSRFWILIQIEQKKEFYKNKIQLSTDSYVNETENCMTAMDIVRF